MKKLLTFILLAVLFSPGAFAATSARPESCAETQWYKPGTWFPCLADKFTLELLVASNGPMVAVETAMTRLMIIDIPMETLQGYWKRMLFVTNALLAVVLVFAGFQWMFGNSGRETLTNLVYTILFTNTSFIFAGALLVASQQLTIYLWRQLMDESIGISFSNLALSINPLTVLLYLIVFLIYGIPFLGVVLLRLVALVLSIVMLPLIVLAYFFLPTQTLGRKFLYQFGANLFFPLVWLFIFLAGKIISETLASGTLTTGLAHVVATAASLYVGTLVYKKLVVDVSLSSFVRAGVKTGGKIASVVKLAVKAAA